MGGVAISDFHLNSLKAAIDVNLMTMLWMYFFANYFNTAFLFDIVETPSSVMRMENDAASANVDASCSAEPQQQGEVD